MTVAGTELHWADVLVIVAYFVAVIAVGLWVKIISLIIAN